MFDESKVKRVPAGHGKESGRFTHSKIYGNDAHSESLWWDEDERALDMYNHLTGELVSNPPRYNTTGFIEKELKKHVVGMLGKFLDAAGIRNGVDVADKLIRSWADDSSSGTSTVWQKAAAGVFGSEISVFMRSAISRFGKYGFGRGVTDEIAEAMLLDVYQRTQQVLKDANISEIRLYRGVGLDSYDDGKIGETVILKANPLSSWSLSAEAANMFAAGNGITMEEHGGYILSARVPADRIVSIPHTGFGCFSENEFVVFSQKGDLAKIIERIEEPAPDEDFADELEEEEETLKHIDK